MLQASENVEHARDHEVSHIPPVTAEERGLDKVLLKNGQLGPQRLFGLIGQGRISLLRGKEDSVPEKRDLCWFHVVGDKERPLEHSTPALRRRWIE
jgi:hypothetical protein